MTTKSDYLRSNQRNRIVSGDETISTASTNMTLTTIMTDKSQSHHDDNNSNSNSNSHSNSNSNSNSNSDSDKHGSFVLETAAMMRARTNFGDYQFYVPPETKATPYSVPNGAPVTPKRDALATPNRLSMERLTTGKIKIPWSPQKPEDNDNEDNEEEESYFVPRPLDEKRLHFFDDAASDLIPFDQVWNQEEFTLADEQRMSDDGNDSEDEESVKSDGSKPFDEAPKNHHDEPPKKHHDEPPGEKLEVSGSSAFTVFSTTSSTAALPPLPPPPPPPQKRKLAHPASPGFPQRLSDRERDAEFPSTSAVFVTSTPLQNLNQHAGRISSTATTRKVSDPPASDSKARDRIPTSPPPSENDEDIPSDEDYSRKRCPPIDGRDKQNISLATASRRTTAEDVGQKTVAEYLSSGNDDEDSDDKSLDSLFDFKDQQSSSRAETDRAPSPSPDRWKVSAPAELSSEDELSLDGESPKAGAIPGLKTRTQEAFASRKRLSPKKTSLQTSSHSSSSPRRAASPSPPQAPKSKAQVSFGATNTIHHFEQEYSVYSDHDESAFSFGTDENGKTIGSDVEEAIRDIFMISALGACNPAPRKIRYHSDTRNERRELEQTSMNSDEDEATLQSEEEEAADTRSSKKGSETSIVEREEVQLSSNDDVFFETMLSMVEGGLGVINAAFGFASSGTTEDHRTTVATSSPRSPKKEKKRSHHKREDSGTIDGVIDSVSDYILGPEPQKSESSEYIEPEAPIDEIDYEDYFEIVQPEEADASQTLEDDPRLLELAKQAAVCMHEVLGVRYDESREVDIEDVKFVVVELLLPLGLIFQEDYSGCWITKILPKGNGEKSGKLEPGDQLAAINGISAISMKVDDICAAITDASSGTAAIELTFLRYVGPFQPLPADGDNPTFVRSKEPEEDHSVVSCPLPDDTLILEDEKPRSTRSIINPITSKLKKAQQGTSKLGKKKFKWFSRGKRSASKAE